MCKYCNDGDRDTFDLLCNGEDFSVSGFIYPNKKELSAYIGYRGSFVFEDRELKVKIAYCPMCGRKL